MKPIELDRIEFTLPQSGNVELIFSLLKDRDDTAPYFHLSYFLNKEKSFLNTDIRFTKEELKYIDTGILTCFDIVVGEISRKEKENSISYENQPFFTISQLFEKHMLGMGGSINKKKFDEVIKYWISKNPGSIE